MPKKTSQKAPNIQQATDIPIKLLLKQSSFLLSSLFKGVPKELPFSLPTDYQAVFERKPDFLGQIGEKTILHIELETLYNPEQIPQRMLLYNYLIFTHFSKLAKEGKFPKNFILKQKILYIGERENIPEKFTYKTEDVEANFSVVRLNQIPAETIFKNGNQYDKLLSILAKLPKGKEKKFLKKLFNYLKGFPEKERRDKLRIVISLLSYRKKLFTKFLELERREEMPIEIPRELLKENPLYQIGAKEGRKKGIEEGRKKGIEEGRKEEAIRILKKILKRRFPSQFKASKYKSLKKLSTSALENLLTVAITAQSLQDFDDSLQRELLSPK